MALKERPLQSPDDVYTTIETNLSVNLPPYRRMEAKDRAREMQKAAFGDEAMEVTGDQYDELIGYVRVLRPWLRQEGKSNEEHPQYRGTEHQIYFLEDVQDQQRYAISFEPKPYEQSAGKYREPYAKFSLTYEDGERFVDFCLNFDDTYDLVIQNKQKGISFVANGLKREHMTQNEYKVVAYAASEVTSHFGIPVQLIA